jgi:hypothetical protein
VWLVNFITNPVTDIKAGYILKRQPMPNNTGDHAEAAFIHHAHRHLDSVEIFTPMTHRTKVDVAVRKPGFPLVGVQVKKATRQRKKCGAFGESWKFLVGSGRSIMEQPQNQ